jgi:thiol-disulfide isomerase/thioredoxin
MAKTFTLAVLLMLMQFGAKAQVVPNIKLSTIEGASFQTQQINEITGKPVVLSFWATWCIPCLNELTAINDNLDDWKKESKFEFYAISEDDSRTAKRVPALVSGKGWTFNVLLDKNQDLKRELNLMNIPYLMVIKDGKIIYRQAGYVAGNENELYKIIKENQ